jgi:hypothetical protein
LKKNTTLRELTLHFPLGATNVSPILTSLRDHPLARDEAGLLGVALCSIPSLQSLVQTYFTLGSAALAELVPALYHNTSIKVLDMSDDMWNGMNSARLLRDILRSNKTMATLDLSRNDFAETTAVECIADGLGSNSTLRKIDLSSCALRDDDVSILAQTLGSQNKTLQKLTLENNIITSTGVGVLLETMEQSCHNTDLDLQRYPIGNQGASLLARFLGNNALPKLTRLSFSMWSIGDIGYDAFIALLSALKQNTSLLHLDLRHSHGFSERAFSALAESLPEIKVLQRHDFDWCTGLAAAMPLHKLVSFSRCKMCTFFGPSNN